MIRRKRLPTRSRPPIDLLIDSGAFSVWRKGATIDLDHYISYCLDNRHRIFGAVALDVIPGRGVSELAAAEQSYRNALIMREAGVDVMPVYHYGEAISHLQRLLDDGFTFIGIGGIARRAGVEKRTWFDRVFKVVSGNARLHCFGVTSPDILRPWPWYSADSISWKLTAAYGQVLVPRLDRRGNPDYARKPKLLTVSNWHTRKGGMATGAALGRAKALAHVRNFGPTEQKLLSEYFKLVGCDLEKTKEDHFERLRVTISYYHGLETYLKRTRVFLTADADIKSFRCIIESGHRNVLTSYHLINKRTPDVRRLWLEAGNGSA